MEKLKVGEAGRGVRLEEIQTHSGMLVARVKGERSALSDHPSRATVLNCRSCGSSNYAEHFDTLRVACNHCAHPIELDFATTPESRHREGALDLGFAALSTWIRGITAVA